jgi:dihydrofolate reductase
MRKIVVLNRVTLDGFFAGPDEQNDWFIPDPEIDAATHQIIHADTMLLGRVTYKEHLERFWPHAALDPNMPENVRTMANEVNGMTKIVFSNTLKEVTWEHSELMHGDLIEEVKRLKQGLGTDILILGSGTIIQQLANADLIDEYVLILTPVVLGTGKLMFKDVKRTDLMLVGSQHFKSGNVVLHYVANTSQRRA